MLCMSRHVIFAENLLRYTKYSGFWLRDLFTCANTSALVIVSADNVWHIK